MDSGHLYERGRERMVAGALAEAAVEERLEKLMDSHDQGYTRLLAKKVTRQNVVVACSREPA